MDRGAWWVPVYGICKKVRKNLTTTRQQQWLMNLAYLRATFSSVQLLSCIRLFATPWTAARQASLSINNSQGPPPNLCPLCRWCHSTISSSVIPFSPGPQSFPASGSFPMNQLTTSGGPKYWRFSFNISPSNEHPGLIFRMDWLDLLAVQGTLKSLLQHHSSKTSI